jgi:GAF domain-containing protein/anti-sigma regulatory factor (Ser/Thr protein kinase)
MRGLRRLFPSGTGLTDVAWRARHRGILAIAWAHAAVVPAIAWVRHERPLAIGSVAAPVVILAMVASVPTFHRRLRSVCATAALLMSSTVLVYVFDGLTEMNFHYFVMVAIVALYQDWLPFAIAIGFVLVHHGVIGTLEPTLVYDSPDAIADPWRWAAVYAGFVAAISAVCVAGWRITQGIFERQQSAERELMDEKRVVETLHSIGTGVVTELDLDRVAQLVTDAAVTAVGAQFGAFFYNVLDVSGERHLLYTLSGAPRSAFESFPMPRSTKIFEPTFSGSAVMRIDDVTADPRYGQNAPYHGIPEGHLPVRSHLAVPVRSRGSSEVLGGLFFGHAEPGVFGEQDERLVVGIATQAAIAFDNARLYQAERRAREEAEGARARLTMLADVGRILVTSLDPDTTLRNVARVTVPTLADLCVVHMFVDGELQRVAVFTAPGMEDLVEGLSDQLPRMDDPNHPVVRVITSGESELVQVTPESIRGWTVNEEHASAVEHMQATGALVVPLIGRDRPIGTISFANTIASGRTFDPDDLPLAEVLGHRAGMAVENARLFQAEREARETADSATRNLALLAETGRLIASTLDEDVALQRLGRLTVPTIADVCLIDVIADEGEIRRIAIGAPGLERFAEGLAPFPPGYDDESHPIIRVMRSGEPLFVEEITPEFLDSITRLQQHRKLAAELHPRSTIIVPLRGVDRLYGTLVLINTVMSNRTFTAADFGLVEEIGRRAGMAVDNARSYRAEREALAAADIARGRLSLLADASRILASSLDVETTLKHIATLTVPRLADICVIDLVGDAGEIRRVVIETGPGLERLTYEIATHPPSRTNKEHPVVRVLDDQAPLLIEHLTPEFIQRVTQGRDEEVQAVAAQALTTLTVPLFGREGVLGAITLATLTTSGRRFTNDDIPLSEELGRRAGVAIENAHLYSQQRTVAESLQHALLPQQLPTIPGFEATARYLPGTPGERVGGDWYDLFETPAGEIAIVMGDVVGHGIPAASLMAQLRNALRAYVWGGKQPSEVLVLLNHLLFGLEPEGMATLAIGLLDPITSRLCFASAGHLPLLHVRGDEAAFVGEGLGPPLGAIPFARYEEAVLELRPNDTAVFYTDGLVEDRTRSIDAGLDDMRRAITEHGDGPLEELSDAVVRACLGDRLVEDDVALLILRSMPLGDSLSLRFDSDPRVLSSLRQTLRRWMYEHGVDESDVRDVLVASGEACNNAIEHGSVALQGSFEIQAEIDEELRVTVTNEGTWREPRDDGGGRGIQLMKALMDDVEIDREDGRIEVRMRRRLTPAGPGASPGVKEPAA